MKLLVATGNEHKLAEIRSILKLPLLNLVSLKAFEDMPEVVEDGETFAANAMKKAVTLALATRLWTIADDSGLEVEELGNAPGVYSARYAGDAVDYRANNAKLLAALAGVENRKACFRCVIALSSPAGRSQMVEGRCEGMIAESARGNGGFGYDPLFVPDGHTSTFAEMASEIKNSISHRAIAIKKASELWSGVLSGAPVSDW